MKKLNIPFIVWFKIEINVKINTQNFMIRFGRTKLELRAFLALNLTFWLKRFEVDY